ncbi:MAG: relaxase/mobilization nuclease domain-containing protein [Muribaculaceae bacterium]|nr:relaxase/mobilization nuclease domain-containing protein [Muribaculaceae bacterium]
MIVKKLSDAHGGRCPSAKYNEDKVAAGVAELMLMANVSERLRQTVETMHRFGLDAAAEVERYLKERSKTYGNTNTDRFQFHVSASVEGRTMTPKELTAFARELMKGMGYEKQPYFVYAHHDTDNNHVHILSTRIQPNGYAISDHQDIRRLSACANRILSSDINKDIERIFSYDYETEGQFANIVRSFGFKIEKSLDDYRLLKNGGHAGNISVGDIIKHITKSSQKRKDRATQLRAIIKKYKAEIADGKYQSLNSPEVSKFKNKKPTRPKSNPDIKKIRDKNGKPLSKERQEQLQQLIFTLKKSFGIDIYFQKDKNGQVRGYGIVDHAGKIAFDGSKIMKLSELIDFVPKQEHKPSPLDVYRDMFNVEIGNDGRNDYMCIKMKDGSTYQKPITLRQVAWYNGVKPDDRGEVALTIAATMFSEEILMAYLARQPIHDFRNRVQSVNAVKNRDGKYVLRITMSDGMPIPMIPMDSQDESYYRRLSPNDRRGYLLDLAVHYLTREDARAIIQRMRQTTKDQTGVRVLSHPKDFTQQTANVFALNFANVLSCFNASTDRGENREWEVGNHSRYDDLDTKQAGSRLSM